MNILKTAAGAVKNFFLSIPSLIKRFVRNKKLVIISGSVALLFILSLIFYRPVLSNIYWKMALSVSDKDFNKAVYYIDKAYDLTHEDFLINVKVGFYINEAKKYIKSNPDKALLLLETCYKFNKSSEAKDLIIRICIDTANSYFDKDIDKCISYINKALSYGNTDELADLARKAYSRLAELKGSDTASKALDQVPDKSGIKGELQKSLGGTSAVTQENPTEPAQIVPVYLNAVASGNSTIMTKYEYTGDRFFLYYHDRDLTPKKYIPKSPSLNIIKVDDISATYGAPDNEKFFSVVYKNNNSDTLIYVLLVNDAGAWKVYGIV